VLGGQLVILGTGCGRVRDIPRNVLSINELPWRGQWKPFRRTRDPVGLTARTMPHYEELHIRKSGFGASWAEGRISRAKAHGQNAEEQTEHPCYGSNGCLAPQLEDEDKITARGDAALRCAFASGKLPTPLHQTCEFVGSYLGRGVKQKCQHAPCCADTEKRSPTWGKPQKEVAKSAADTKPCHATAVPRDAALGRRCGD